MEGEWLASVEAEHGNLRAALRWALNRDDHDLALRLAGSSATFWWVRGYWGEGFRWLEEALAQPAPADPSHRTKALEGAAHLAARLRRHEAAKAFAGECLAICEGLEDVRGAGRALRILSIVALGERDYEGFYDLAQRSATYARKSHDLWTLSMALNNLGYRELEEGRAEKAISLFEEALDLARARGDERSESFFLENLGLAKLGQGSIDEARDDFEASLRLAHRLRYIELIAEDLLCLAAVATTAGDFDRAARLMGGAEHLREELGVAGLDPLEELLHVRVLSALERELEPTACDEALRSGRRLDQDRLVELALAP